MADIKQVPEVPFLYNVRVTVNGNNFILCGLNMDQIMRDASTIAQRLGIREQAAMLRVELLSAGQV